MKTGFAFAKRDIYEQEVNVYLIVILKILAIPKLTTNAIVSLVIEKKTVSVCLIVKTMNSLLVENAYLFVGILQTIKIVCAHLTRCTLMVLVRFVQPHLCQMLRKQVAFVIQHHKYSLWREKSVRNVLPTHLLMKAKKVVNVTKDTGKKMEVVYWIYVLKTQNGTKENFSVSAVFQENILLIKSVELVR